MAAATSTASGPGRQGTTLVRLPDWPERLARFLAENRGRPFRWGAFDCCLFACNCVRELTGVDVAAPYRGRYHTLLGSLRITGGSIGAFAERVARLHGADEHRAFRDARPGDVVLGAMHGGETLGVASPQGFAVFCAPNGLADYPFSAVTRAWKVG